MAQCDNSGERKSPDAILELWQEYHQSGAAGVRDRLVLTLAPMVKYIVFRELREYPRAVNSRISSPAASRH